MKFFPLFDTIAKFASFPDHRHYLLTAKGVYMRQPKSITAGVATIRVIAKGGSQDSCGSLLLAICGRHGMLNCVIGNVHFDAKRKISLSISIEQIDALANGKRWDGFGLLSSSFPVRGRRNAVWIEALDANGNVIL